MKPIALILLVGTPALFCADLRLATNGVVSVQFTLKPGGRVGNWRPDGTVVLDAPPKVQLGQPHYTTDIFTLQVPAGNPPYSATLTSLSDTFSGTKPQLGTYIGNAWFCPTSDGHPENEYMLFQAQDAGSVIFANANPGIGLDNQLWLYHAGSKKVWQLTWYKNLSQISPTVVPGGGVLGPQCSEDSDSSTNTLHIVYAHIIQATPQAIACNPKSDGTCGWFGDWELVYADIKFAGNDPSMDDPVCTNTSTPETPCFTLTHGSPVNPRDLVNSPITPVSGTDGTVTLTTCGTNGTYLLTTSANQAFQNIPLGAGVKIGATYPYDYAIVDSISNNYKTLCLIGSVHTGTNLPFTIHNLNYIEPHRYLSDGGDLYYSTNSLFILHDSAGAVFNVNNGTLRVLNNGYPPGTTPPGINNPTNTWFNEFLTPVPSAVTMATPKPPPRMIFMSDRAVPTKYSNVPEWSDHYMCGPPNCQIPVRLTEYNFNNGNAGGPDATCSTCSPTVATRGAWSPDGTQYLTMNQNLNPSGMSTAELHLYTLNFPSAELGGQAKLSGQTKMH